MTYLGPNHEAFDLKFTYDIADLQSTATNVPAVPDSIMGLLDKNKDFSKFTYLVRLASLEDKFNNLTTNFTLFIPSDTYLNSKYSEAMFVNMDTYTAREIVLYSTLNRKVIKDMIFSSNCMYLETNIDKSVHSTILCENYGNITLLDNRAKIKKYDIPLNNGIIHVIDDLLIPPVFVNSFKRYQAY